MKISPVSFKAKGLISTEFNKDDEIYIRLKAKSFDNNKKQNTIVISAIEKMDNAFKGYITTLKADYFEKKKHVASATTNIPIEEMHLPDSSRKKKINMLFDELDEKVNKK